MLPALASLEDLEDRGIDISDIGTAVRAQAALNDASALIRVEAGADWVGTGNTLDFGDMDQRLADALVSVCCAVVQRVLNNPQGATSMSLGDASVTLTDASTDVYLTRNERRIIRRAAGLGAVGSVELYVGTPGYGGGYINVGQTEPLPFTYEPLRP